MKMAVGSVCIYPYLLRPFLYTSACLGSCHISVTIGKRAGSEKRFDGCVRLSSDQSGSSGVPGYLEPGQVAVEAQVELAQVT